MRIQATKQFNFCYGHRLPEHPGKCAQWHGHNAVLEITVERNGGRTSEGNRMVMDFGTIKEIVQPSIDKFDHANLNDTFENPTCEELAAYLFSILNLRFKEQTGNQVRVIKLKITETPTSWVMVME